MSARFYWSWLGACMAIYLCRGVASMCLLGPVEGWDEYQHIMYFKELGRGRIPKLGETRVDRYYFREIADWPAPKGMVEQFPNGGVVGYADRAAGLGAKDLQETPPLYQAQHTPVYYVFHARVLNFAAAFWQLPAYVAVLRFVNLLWSALAIVCVADALRRLQTPAPTFAGALLLLAVHPLWLMNSVRVSNDAMSLALAFAGLAFAAGKPSRAEAVLAGLFVGQAGLTKATAWAAAPVGLACLLISRSERRGNVSVYSAIVASCFVLALFWNRHIHGLFMPTQESYHLHIQGKSFGDVLAAIGSIDWFREWERRLGRDLVFIGGWSFAPIPKFLRRAHEWLLVGTLLVGAFHFFGRVVGGARFTPHPAAARPPSPARGEGIICAATAIFFAILAMSLHMVQTQAAYGFVGTPVWYAAIALPWWCLMVVGVLPARFRWRGTAVWIALFLVVESVGWHSLATIQAASSDARVIYERIAAMHPEWLPPWLGMAAWSAAACGACGLLLIGRRISPNMGDENAGGS